MDMAFLCTIFNVNIIYKDDQVATVASIIIAGIILTQESVHNSGPQDCVYPGVLLVSDTFENVTSNSMHITNQT